MIELTGIDRKWTSENEEVIYTFKVRIDPKLISILTTESHVTGSNCYVYSRDNVFGVVETIEEVEAKISGW